MSNAHIIRCGLLFKLNSIKEISNFKAFLDNHKDFSMHHESDLVRKLCNKVEAIKSMWMSLLLKSIKRVRAAFNSSKNRVFLLLIDP